MNIKNIASQLEKSSIFHDTFDLVGKAIVGFVFVCLFTYLFKPEVFETIIKLDYYNTPVHIYIFFGTLIIISCSFIGFIEVTLINGILNELFSITKFFFVLNDQILHWLKKRPKVGNLANYFIKINSVIYLYLPLGSYYALGDPDINDDLITKKEMLDKFYKYFELTSMPNSLFDGLADALVASKTQSDHEHVEQFRGSIINGGIGHFLLLFIFFLITGNWQFVLVVVVCIYLLLVKRRRLSEDSNLNRFYKAYLVVLSENKRIAQVKVAK